MQAGKLKKWFDVDRPDTSQNETGEEIIEWHNVGRIQAHARPLSGREAIQLNVNLAELNTVINTRWSPSTDRIQAKWRLRRRNLIYDIKNVAHLELDQREIEFHARSGVNEG